MSDVSWTDAKSDLNTLVGKLRRVHENLPSFYSDSVKGWDVSNAYEACVHLRSAIAALEPLTNRPCV